MPAKHVSAYIERLKIKLCERKKSYLSYSHITLEFNHTGRSECRTYPPRVQDSLKRRQTNLKLHHPKT